MAAEEIKFGTDGWRGVIAEDYTFENVRRVAGAIAAYVLKNEDPSRGLVIGYDTRFGSRRFAQAAAEVLAAAGISIKLSNDYTPTPALSYAVRSLKTAGGIMITSSHNPWDWNGVKFKATYGGSATPAIMKKIEAEMAAGSMPKGTRATIEEVDLKKEYVKAVCAFADMDLISRTKFKFAVDAMYAWLARHPKLAKPDVLVDTGSGLSYRTRITPHELVSIFRNAAGFTDDVAPDTAHAWLDSLSIAGTDGTLVHRFQKSELRGHIHGKTGSLSTVIALSGVLDIDPLRPLVFSIVTNGDRPLSKGYIRRAHEQVIGLLSKYIEKTTKTVMPAPKPEPATTTTTTTTAPADESEESSEPELDNEAATSK